MRCHYEVLELQFQATDDEIKKAYRKKSLLWHPDKNVGNEDEATERFKEISTAYHTLIDPQERKWYDDHRDSILRGGDGTTSSNEDGDDVIPIPNLWQYFNSSCWSNDNDFYELFNQVFNEIETIEMKSISGSNRKKAPLFGDSSLSSQETLSFYNHWCDFVSNLTFAWEDHYTTTDAPNRTVRRAIEKENKKFRDSGKRKYHETVRALVKFVRRHDPRITIIEREATQRKKNEELLRAQAQAQKVEDRRLARLRAEVDFEDERIRREEERKGAFLLADEEEFEYIYVDENGNEINADDGNDSNDGNGNGRSTVWTVDDASDDDDNNIDNNNNSNDDDDQDEERERQVEVLECTICNKSFKSKAQLMQHQASKVHRKNVKDAAKKGKSKKGKSASINTSTEPNESIHEITTSRNEAADELSRLSLSTNIEEFAYAAIAGPEQQHMQHLRVS